ncbi:MAG: tetratricopeptide repeat protein [Opitutaceae bacterium]|nr:tetratricopeptide repeat protein [Opitutaceae bacterium]
MKKPASPLLSTRAVTPSAATASSWPAWIAVGLFIATACLFARAIGHDFVNYDDPDYVTANLHVKAGLSADGVAWALRSGEASNWHPLTWVSHMADVSLFGLNPRGHHATSVLLHALNAALAFLALRRLTGSLWTSALCAAWFAWHPLRVESVAWVAERKDVLSGLFFFATLWAYAVYAERRRERRPDAWRPYALALGAFALGLMAKPMLVTLPCVLLLLDVWPLRRVAGEKRESLVRLVVEKLPWFALAVASSFVTYQVQSGGGSVTEALSLSARLDNAVVSVVRYLGKLAWPFDLAVIYPHPGEWPARKVVACLVIVAGLTAFAVWQHRRRPWLAIGWLWFLGTLVPVIGLVQVGLQSMADRYTYLPMLGVQIAVLWTAREWAVSPTVRRWGLALAGVVLLCGAARTWDQIGVWKNSFTLFSHALSVTEKNYVAHDNRGLFLFQSGKVAEAIADYRASLAINPGYFTANNNLGHALAEAGRPAEAIPLYRTALAQKPGHLEVRNNLANALSDLNQLPEAMEHYAFVLARQPDHVNALNGSAVVLAMQGKVAEAKARLEQSLRLAPDNASAHHNLGNVCSMLGDREAAARHYRRAAELKSGGGSGRGQAPDPAK